MTGATICLTFDFDGICVWPGTFGLTSPTPLSRGEFGPRVAMPRILDVLEREQVPATLFTPGHTMETWPELCQRAAAAGHEFGHHGYFHESPVTLEESEERRVLERGLEAFERVLGSAPKGYRSPAFDLSPNSVRLLHEYGFTYDSSMMAQDFEPYYCRVGDELHRDAAFVFGEEIALVEVPVSWSLDDFPQLEFVVAPPLLFAGNGDPVALERRWLADLDYMLEEVPAGVFTITFHPQTIGRGARIRVLEAIIGYAKERGASFATVAEAVAKWQAARPGS